MCSTGERLAQLGLAIDQLAAETSTATGRARQPGRRAGSDATPRGMDEQLAGRTATAGRDGQDRNPAGPEQDVADTGAGIADTGAGIADTGAGIADPGAGMADPVRARQRQARRPADSGEGPAGRVAELWAMLAELDPELARRLPGYLS